MPVNPGIYELIDRIVGLDIGGRGITGLYAPARTLVSEPICAAAARTLAGLSPGDRVFILTGSLSRAGVSTAIAENDGPIGVAVLARALTYGFNAIPVVLVDETIADKTAAIIKHAGPNVLTQDQADIAVATPRYTSVAVVESGVIDEEPARALARDLMDRHAPKVVISVERAGMSADGTYRNMLGQDYSEGRAKLDYIIEEAQQRGIPTIGVGDGGNEIGFGAIRDAVAEHIPHGDILCANLATDIVYPVGVSNWGCYAIAAALALMANKPDIAHSAALERRLIEASPGIGLIDGTTGKLDATVDGMPTPVHESVVTLLAQAVQKGLADD
ncbi:MAG: glutamate cyclase domain-containing protein [Alphaproteobacteria bacterium]